MINRTAVLALAAAVLLNVTATQAAEDKNIVVAAATPATETQSTTQANDTASNEVAGQSKPGEMIDFDPMDPKGWAKVMDPKTHWQVHSTVTNPRFYARFMTPAYYTKFMNPKTWMSYMDMSTYQPLLKVVSDPETAKHWVNPASYVSELTHASYTQIVDPQSYVAVASTVAAELKSEPTEATYAMFNPTSWMKTFSEVASAAKAKATGQAAQTVQ